MVDFGDGVRRERSASEDFASGSWKAISGTWEMSSIKRGACVGWDCGGSGNNCWIGISAGILKLNAMRCGATATAGGGIIFGAGGVDAGFGRAWKAWAWTSPLRNKLPSQMQKRLASRINSVLCLTLGRLAICLESAMILPFQR